ncbi:tyrosine-type recombinase/integrase [Roseomonas xinghualingensis]|uniref:tyrosine-type recombinase/integrase n=1 Tax=Roseomonas xinghualingensis TaxID=2986475 RepID=UPI0021F0BEA0|nr:site-specific integrase [Roseomonas sp. SXEYE001]MCV4209445.1 site-specific integrase [Roseomonas sp. SXEYE001]
MGERVRLTDATVAALRCPPNRKDMTVADASLPGFWCRVGGGAGSKVFLYRYKRDGRSHRVVLGTFGQITTAAARRKAEGLRGQVVDARDPLAERRAARAAARAAEAVSKAEAARAAFTVRTLIQGWSDHHLAERSASYRTRVPREMRAALAGWLDAPAADFGHADAVRALDDAKASRGPVAANRLQAVARACWGWACKRGTLAANPWQATPKPSREVSRDRVLSDAELTLVWHAAGTLGHPWTPIIRLMILTGQRRGEVAELRWAELDLDGATWNLPAARAKNGRANAIPLPPPAVATLRALPRVQVDEEPSPLVFCNARGTAPSGFGRAVERLTSAVAKARIEAAPDAPPIAPFTLHDLRRTVATGLQRLGVRLEVTEAVLNHVSGSRSGIVGVYQRHGWDREKRTALDAWAGHVETLADRSGQGGNVMALRERRA